MFPHRNSASNVPAVVQDTEVPIVTSAKQNDHLLKPPPCFACFIPLPTLPVSALVHSMTLPEFDPTLAELDICKFFSLVDCNISDIASGFLQCSIPPLPLSSRLLDAFDEAELILLLRAHFSEDDNVYMTDYSPSSQSQATTLTLHPTITLNYRISLSMPRTGLLKHFSMVSHKDYLADIHRRDLKHKDKQCDAVFSAALKDTERKYQKHLNDRNHQQMLMCQQLKQSAQSVHDAQVHLYDSDDPDMSAFQPSQSLVELSHPHHSVKEELHRVKKPSHAGRK
ncbi:hypothetical protein EV702DRAFT_1202740 [Suillus placidus]|uniref:Uncharacterized protein n=1 Tax=Suillus placidus TaxID=48579 RepID=A0A9P7CYP5_9AGAM|nr:hypothetical protein EV702DRAFT_1202740 [Suillus placidus]